MAGPYFSTPPQRGEGLVLGSKLGVENVRVRHCLEKASQMCVCVWMRWGKGWEFWGSQSCTREGTMFHVEFILSLYFADNTESVEA